MNFVTAADVVGSSVTAGSRVALPLIKSKGKGPLKVSDDLMAALDTEEDLARHAASVANVFLAGAVEDHPHHAIAKSWLDGLSSQDTAEFCRITQAAFLRLLSNQHPCVQRRRVQKISFVRLLRPSKTVASEYAMCPCFLQRKKTVFVSPSGTPADTIS
ncbi:MAG TPA: hypothetical protein VK850_05800 [Candidatus Binatia bacterium]|nr:hypothetical protein [Candidatus Binatia bacterium]